MENKITIIEKKKIINEYLLPPSFIGAAHGEIFNYWL